MDSDAPNEVFVPNARDDFEPFWMERFCVVPFSAGKGAGKVWALATTGDISAITARACTNDLTMAWEGVWEYSVVLTHLILASTEI